ncbi:Uncharacterized conserved protein, DUF2141 family [Duganella sp. CF517]|uniref:DUF2141 domain-containing protein n=1 Tax=Duganella sp. CF517 TaxID=1881038 RepID=UPI0008BB0C51|nr:DUF2141 domain-containing protein [Duganella sp. CF517]SEN79534.1 Uncharacterized conserved protein, DUF2141 family [Duganella sp. CF517]
MPCHTTTAFLAFASISAAAGAGAADLTITVEGVASADGRVMVALYNSAGTFRGKPYLARMTPASAGAVTLELKELPAGDYAFAVYHDANGNGKLDLNALGMPVEDYAFSNNAMGNRGAPAYEDARFQVPAGGAAVNVNLR